MGTVIDELVTILGFEVDGKARVTVDKFIKGIDGVASAVAKVSSILVTGASTVSYFAEKFAEAGAEIDKFSQLTGIASNTVQGWMFASEQAGGSAQSLTRDLDSLTRSMSSPIPGEFNHALFMMGISASDAAGNLKGADDVLLEIADKMKGMSAARQIQWGSKIGLSDDTIRLLQLGREEIERLKQQAADIPTIVDDESLKNSRLFLTQLKLVRRVFAYIGQEVSSSAGPAIREIVQGLIDWVKLNREFIHQGLKNLVLGIVTGFQKFVGMLTKLKQKWYETLPGLKDFVDVLTKSGVVSDVVFAALTSLAVVAGYFAAPWIAIAAGITLAGLALADFLAYMNGDESLFGDFFEEFPAIEGFLKSFLSLLGNVASFVKDVLVLAFKGWVEIFRGLFRAADAFLSLFGFARVEKQVAQLAKPSFGAGPQMQSNHSGGNQIAITNNINGDNAPAIASETTRKMQFSLQQMSAGALAPAGS